MCVYNKEKKWVNIRSWTWADKIILKVRFREFFIPKFCVYKRKAVIKYQDKKQTNKKQTPWPDPWHD
jgi:hypothetical protein